MRYKVLVSDYATIPVAEPEGMAIEIAGFETVALEKKDYRKLKENHKDFEFDRKSNTIKKKPKKEKE